MDNKNTLKEELYPSLLQTCMRFEAQHGKRIVVRDQWDNAILHIKTNVKTFNGRHCWLMKMQPSNRLLTSVCDAALFPVIAQKCTALQGIVNGGHYPGTREGMGGVSG